MSFDKPDHALDLSADKTSGSSNATAARQLSEGELIAARYRIVSLIGQGAVGSVYVVDQILLKKRFAMKTLNPIAATDIVVRRFHNEAQTMSRLDHPNIVRSIDFGLIDNNQPFLVMDYVEGQTLSQVLKEKGNLSVDMALQIFIPICFAIGYAHQEGVVHRDIKPSNILLAKSDSIAADFVPKIVDFGISKLVLADDGQSLTRTGEVFGTPLYMSPEQCSGKKIDKRSDIYSLGCVIYEALTGSPPFIAQTALETMMQHSTAQLPSMKDASLGYEIPTPLENIIAKMLAKDPGERYQSCLEAAEELIRFQTNPLAVSVKKIVDQNRNSSKSSKSNLSKAMSVAVAACTIFGALACAWYLRSHTEERKKEPPGQVAEQTPLQSYDEQPIKEADVKLEKFQPPGGAFAYEDAKSSDKSHFHFPPISLGTIFYWDSPIHVVSVGAKGTIALPACKPIFLLDSTLMDAPFLAHYFSYPDFLGLVEDFHFSDTESLDKVNEPLTQLSGLRLAYFRKIELSDVAYAHLNSLPKLTWLVGRRSFKAEKIADFSRLREFTVLGLEQSTQIRTVLKKLAGSKNIKRLSVDGTDISTEDISLIAKCPSLTHLNLLHTFNRPSVLTDKQREECMAQLATLPELRYLAVGLILGTKKHLSAEVLKHLSAMKKLEVLYLQGPLKKEMLAQIQSYLNPNCRISAWVDEDQIPDDPERWFDPRFTNPDIDKLW